MTNRAQSCTLQDEIRLFWPCKSGSSFPMNSIVSDRERSFALQLYEKTEHLNSELYIQLSRVLPSVHKIDRQTFPELQRIPCVQWNVNRSHFPIPDFTTTIPLEIIYLDVSGAVDTTYAEPRYAPSLLDDYTAKSDVIILKTKDEIFNCLFWYKNRS